jgi:hypothetical protein
VNCTPAWSANWTRALDKACAGMSNATGFEKSTAKDKLALRASTAVKNNALTVRFEFRLNCELEPISVMNSPSAIVASIGGLPYSISLL